MTAQPVLAGRVLEVASITGGYGDITALWDVDLYANRGEVTVVFGRNGAGKTTLLSTIAGLLPCRGGRITFAGQDVTKAPAHLRSRAGIAMVQENKRIFRRRTVNENLVLGGHSLDRTALREAIELAYQRFPALAGRRKEPAGALSGGQQQMLAIGQALMPGPTLLMLDEPSMGLAPAIVSQMIDTVAQLKQEGLAIVLVEQLVTTAMSVADHITVLDQGRVAGAFDPDEHRDTGFLRKTYLHG